MSLYFVYDERFKLHLTGKTHPEQPERVEVIFEALKHAGLLKKENLLAPRKATLQELLLVHTLPYIEKVKEEVASLYNEAIGELSTGDVMISRDSFEIALLAAGAGLIAIDHVIANHSNSVFCIIRPPGHHAFPDHGEGFCLFNNVAIAARYAQTHYGIGRILIVDWDVHHGNGTEHIFYEDPTLFYFSTHQTPLYPGTGQKEESGKGEGLGTTMNVPIGSVDHPRVQILRALSLLEERMEEFQPELVLISCGFDAHKEDSLGGFDLCDEDYETMTYILKRIAARYSRGRIVSLLEGGYNLEAIARSAVFHAKGLLLY